MNRMTARLRPHSGRSALAGPNAAGARAGSTRLSHTVAATLLAATALLACGPTAWAADVQRENQVSFSATATVELPFDTLSVTLRAQREGAEAAAVQSQLKQVLDAALLDARRLAQPEAMEVSTGGFNLSPRHGRDGKLNGWTGSADLLLQGRDVARVAATAGQLGGMAIVAAGYSLSRQVRDKEETALAARAIQQFRSRASEVAQQFGFNGYTLGEVNVQTVDTDSPGRPPMLAMRSVATSMADSAPLPTEAGKGSLSVTVHGSITLTR